MAVAKGSLQYVPGVYDVMRIEPEAIDYFTMPTHFTCENALRDLAGSGVTCPPFREYAPRLIEFMRAHPEYSAQAMI
jgi:hypothetical protein